VPHLPPNVQLVAVDLPGHGQSSHKPPGSDYAILDYIRDTNAIAAGLGWQTFHLLGHSLGASICGLFAGTFPERVCSLNLIEGATGKQSSVEGQKKGGDGDKKDVE
jgi:pimeloyl-ACP methyl ester carboxylesterase